MLLYDDLALSAMILDISMAQGESKGQTHQMAPVGLNIQTRPVEVRPPTSILLSRHHTGCKLTDL